MTVISLGYYSTSTVQMSADALTDMLVDARAHNREHDITGLLTYVGGEFRQIIEGPSEYVDALYASIREDPRHTDVTLVDRHRLIVRQFPHWAMAFQGDTK